MGGHTRVIEAIDAGKHEVREEARRKIEEIEAWRTEELDKLERARISLVGGGERTPSVRTSEGPNGTPRPRKRRRRKTQASPSRAGLLERRENVFRCISESAEPCSSGELSRTLGYGLHATHTALAQLLKEQRITRIGTSSNTRYVLHAGLARSGSPEPLPVRVLSAVEDRISPTAEELAQALGEPVEGVVSACAALQAEERLHMARRDGRPVYVLPASAVAVV